MCLSYFKMGHIYVNILHYEHALEFKITKTFIPPVSHLLKNNFNGTGQDIIRFQ